MNHNINQTYLAIKEFCIQNANPALVEKYSRYFTDGYDAYGVAQKAMETYRENLYSTVLTDWNADDCMKLGDILVASGKYEESIFAIWLIMKHKKQYTITMFDKIGEWLANGFSNWAQVDVVSGEVLSDMLIKQVVMPSHFIPWTQSVSVWQRRAVPVSFIKPAKKGADVSEFFSIIEPMLPNREKPVQQGNGWFLRECWKLHPDETEAFLLLRKDLCGGILLQYATEKMTKEQKAVYSKRKKKV